MGRDAYFIPKPEPDCGSTEIAIEQPNAAIIKLGCEHPRPGLFSIGVRS